MKTYYLSGPMTGLPEYNYPYFEHVTTRLRALGLTVVSPHEIPEPEENLKKEALWKYYMNKCEEQMLSCNALIQLRGWMHSSGARLEFSWAVKANWKHFYFYQDNPGKLVPLHRETGNGV